MLAPGKVKQCNQRNKITDSCRQWLKIFLFVFFLNVIQILSMLSIQVLMIRSWWPLVLVSDFYSQFVQEFLAIWNDRITWMSGDKWDKWEKWDEWDKRFDLWKMAVKLHHGDQDLQMYLLYLLNQSFHVFHCRFLLDQSWLEDTFVARSSFAIRFLGRSSWANIWPVCKRWWETMIISLKSFNEISNWWNSQFFQSLPLGFVAFGVDFWSS